MTRVYIPGEDPLAVRPMTPDEIADLVERARASGQKLARRTSESTSRSCRALTPEQVVELRNDRSRGIKLRRLVKKYGVSLGSVCRIAAGTYYRDVGGPLTGGGR